MTLEAPKCLLWVDFKCKHPLNVTQWYGVSQKHGTSIMVVRDGKEFSVPIQDVKIGDRLVNDENGELYEIISSELNDQ